MGPSLSVGLDVREPLPPTARDDQRLITAPAWAAFVEFAAEG
ncbi:hypothetical protein [Streptomyces sp. cmx-18-6]